MHRVFLSYAYADRNFATRLRKRLESHGCRIVSEDFQPGESLDKTRLSQLSRADVVILIFSEEALNSPWVSAEIGAATAFESKLTIPIVLDGAKPPLLLQDRLYITSSSDDPEKAIGHILGALRERSIEGSKGRALLVSSFISVLASFLGVATSLVASDLGKTAIPFLARIHWTVWVCSVTALYGVACYINDRLHDNNRKLESIFTVPVWTQLRGFGDKRVARISYFALAIIPIIAYAVSDNPFNIEFFKGFTIPLGFRLTFFASWFFSIALILFVAGCPKPFRQQVPFESARTVNLVLHESPGANVKVDAPADVEDPALDTRALELRATCFIFYLLGIAVAAIILARAAWFVTQA